MVASLTVKRILEPEIVGIKKPRMDCKQEIKKNFRDKF